MELYAWLTELSSASPAPGGGGASALVGAVASSLGSMVANLTTGKKKYACYQADIERILAQTADLTARLHGLIAADAEAFVPLSAAYGIPKDDPTRAERLESALRVTSSGQRTLADQSRLLNTKGLLVTKAKATATTQARILLTAADRPSRL